AGRAGDHVGADAGVGHARADTGHAVGIAGRVVAAAHALQDGVAAALQGHVEVRHEAPALRHEVDDAVVAQVGFDAADAEAVNALHLVQRFDQHAEVLGRCAFRAVGHAAEIAGVHAGEHDLAHTLGG